MTKIIVRNDQGYKAYHNGGIYWKLCTAPSTPPVPPGPDPTEPFYVENDTNNAITVTISKFNSPQYFVTVYTSSDGKSWSLLGNTQNTNLSINVPQGEKVYVAADGNWYVTNAGWHIFDKCTKVGGNILSLIYGTQFNGQTTQPNTENARLSMIFRFCKTLTDASKLIMPLTLSNDMNSLQEMFRQCSNLLYPPALPATTLTPYCYNNLFLYCASLTIAPDLPATTLADSCYAGMFGGCTSLTTAPDLPGTQLVSNCYRFMFNGCTNLNYIKCLATNISASNCLQGWLSGVASTGTFVKKAGVSYPSGANGIPSGWTVEEE